MQIIREFISKLCATSQKVNIPIIPVWNAKTFCTNNKLENKMQSPRRKNANKKYKLKMFHVCTKT